MDEIDSQDARDADWETSQEITITLPRSSVAQRTRSKTEHIRDANMSQLRGNMNRTMEGSFEILDDKTDDPLDTNNTADEWSGKAGWIGGLDRLDNSMKIWKDLDNEDRKYLIESFKENTEIIAKENKEMKEKLIDQKGQMEKEIEGMKKVTFNIDKPAYN